MRVERAFSTTHDEGIPNGRTASHHTSHQRELYVRHDAPAFAPWSDGASSECNSGVGRNLIPFRQCQNFLSRARLI